MSNDFDNIYLVECMIFLLIIHIIPIIKEVYIKRHKKEKKRKRYFDDISPFSSPLKTNLFSIHIIIVLVAAYFVVFSSDSLIEDKDISKKVATISNNLKETATELTNIQNQLEARIEYVENLKREAEIAENVISLSEEQVNAVQSKINQELNASSSKGTLMSFLISALFFALGLIVQPTINFFRRKNNKYINKSNETNQLNKEELLNLLNEAKNVLENNSDTLPKSD